MVCLATNLSFALENSEIKDIVLNLGRKSGYETDTQAQSIDFFKLNKNKSLAIRYLVKELRPIDGDFILIEDEEKHIESLHVVWCLRALRFLSDCVFFTEKERNDRLNDHDQNRVMLLMEKKDNEYSFFAASGSRDKIYIAPKYAQKSIIEKWNNWAKNYKKLNSNTCREVTIWYF